MGSSGPEAVELAAACGLVLDPWQADFLWDGMAERADGSWAAAEVALIASRQNGKNGAIEARELFGAVILGEQIIHTSHLFKTTRESFGRLRDLIEANREVHDCMSGSVASAQSGFEMRFRNGGRVTFIARSRSSGRGLTGDLLIFDEAQELNDDAQGALLPTISARPGAQAWYLGSAPNLGSTVFHRIRKRGRAGTETRLSYREHSAEPDADPDDPQARAMANPALGPRITVETVESERRSMSPEMFLRERLSISPDIDDLEGVFPTDIWHAVCSPKVAADATCFAIDLNPERTVGGIVAAGDGPILEVVDYRQGVGWIEPRAVELWERYRVPIVIAAKGPAGSLIAPLELQGVEVISLSEDEMVKAAGGFYDTVIERGVQVRSNADLDRAVRGAAKRMVGDAFTWARKGSAVDISLLVAATAALWVQSGGDGESKYEAVGLMSL